jgi:hypothetical protein
MLLDYRYPRNAFLGNKPRRCLMDESRVADFISSGNWPGEKLELKAEYWQQIIERMLSECSKIYNSMSGFSPISSLIINEKLEIRDERSLVFFHNLSMNTHCHQVGEIFMGTREDNLQRTFQVIDEKYFITRKKEWLAWRRTIETVIVNQNGITNDTKSSLLCSDFAKADLAYILNKKKNIGHLIASNIFGWLMEDIRGSESLLNKKREAMGFVRDIFRRSDMVAY